MNLQHRLQKLEGRITGNARCPSCGWPLPGTLPITAADVRAFPGVPFAPIVLPDAKIRKLSDCLDYVSFWQQEKQLIEKKVEAIGWQNLPVDGFFRDYERYYKTVFENIAKVAALLNDWNSLSPELLEANSFERLLNAIEARIASLR